MPIKKKLSSNYRSENPYDMSPHRQTNKKQQTTKLTNCSRYIKIKQ